MSKLARALALAAMLAAMNLAGLTAVAQAHTSNDPASHDVSRPATDRQLSGARHQRRVTSPQQAAADAAHLRLLQAEERSSIPTVAPAQAQVTSPVRPAQPSGQAGWLTPALSVLAAVLALVAGFAVLAARRARRRQHAGQTA
jgi:hypothetical protein